MQRNTVIGLTVLSICLFVTAIAISQHPANIAGGISYAHGQDAARRAELSRVYDLSFTLTKAPAGNMNIYIPRYTVCDFETALYYAELFRIEDDYTEYEAAYSFTNERETLYIYKSTGILEYISNLQPTQSDLPTLPDDEAAIKMAQQFIEDAFLFLDYEEAQVDFDGSLYTVTFITRLGNLKNYAMPHHVTMDKYGRITRMRYHYLRYERLKSCRIKSMYDAYLELPDSLPPGEKVDLQKAQLVYIYENSIVQPAYYFQGQIGGSKTFSCFVKSAVYE